MLTETIKPENEAAWLELRKQDITSTEVSALFGCSPYATEFELWHRKHDGLDSGFEENERSTWGNRLQDSIAGGVAADQGWTIRRMDEYVRLPILRMGASFDFSIEAGKVTPPGALPFDIPNGILEVKNVDSLIFKQNWIEYDAEDGGGLEAPPHIEIQLQHQLLVSGRSFGYIAAFIGGNKVVLIKREADAVIHEAIKQKVAAFWASIEAHQEPAPDFKKDSAFIAKLYKYATPDKVKDMSGDESFNDLCRRHKEFGDAEKAAKTEKDAIKAEILMLVGDAEKVVGDGGFSSLTLNAVGPAHVEYDREGYRMFKINWPRAKKAKA